MSSLDTTEPSPDQEPVRVRPARQAAEGATEARETLRLRPGAAAGLDNAALEDVAMVRETIFDRLVSGENDVVGLLAYSLSMQNKRDWLAAFQAEKGRDPNPDELGAYDIGERIERRLATYRKLAENALAGNSFWASAALTPVSELPGAPVSGAYSPPAPNSATSSGVGFTTAKGKRGFDTGGKLAIACGVFLILVAAAYAARQWIGI
jgi:hypothetical protein